MQFSKSPKSNIPSSACYAQSYVMLKPNQSMHYFSFVLNFLLVCILYFISQHLIDLRYLLQSTTTYLIVCIELHIVLCEDNFNSQHFQMIYSYVHAAVVWETAKLISYCRRLSELCLFAMLPFEISRCYFYRVTQKGVINLYGWIEITALFC